MEFRTLKEDFSNFSTSTLMEIWTLRSHGEWVLPRGEGLGVVGSLRHWFTNTGLLDSEVGVQC